MAKKRPDLIAAHEQSHQHATAMMRKLNDVLINASLPRRAGDFTGLEKVQRLTDQLAKEILPHLDNEEKTLYPYLCAHIPKLDAVVKYLIAEHADFRERFQELCHFLKDLSESTGQIDREKYILKIQQTGTYLVFLFRNHVRAEREGLFRVADEALKLEEKMEVMNLL